MCVADLLPNGVLAQSSGDRLHQMSRSITRRVTQHFRQERVGVIAWVIDCGKSVNSGRRAIVVTSIGKPLFNVSNSREIN